MNIPAWIKATAEFVMNKPALSRDWGHASVDVMLRRSCQSLTRTHAEKPIAQLVSPVLTMQPHAAQQDTLRTSFKMMHLNSNIQISHALRKSVQSYLFTGATTPSENSSNTHRARTARNRTHSESTSSLRESYFVCVSSSLTLKMNNFQHIQIYDQFKMPRLC